MHIKTKAVYARRPQLSPGNYGSFLIMSGKAAPKLIKVSRRMKMKKIIALALAIIMLLSFAACKGNEPAAPAGNDKTENTLATVTPGKLTVATSPDFAPYEFYAIGADGPYLAGFDMALAKYIADELGLELEIIPMDFDGTIMELSMGNVDMSLAGYSIEEDRKEVMDFSVVYYGGGQSLVTTKANAEKIVDLASANDPSVTVEAQVGSIQAALMAQNTPDANCIEMVKVTDIIAELLSGKAQAAFIESVVAESYQKNYPELVIVCDVPHDSEGSAAGIKKGNTALVDAVNAAIEKCISSGEFDKFVQEAKTLAEGEIFEGLIEENK